MKLFLLSKEYVLLAKSEVEALIGKGKLDENVFLVNSSKTTDRLAYTKMICKVLFTTSLKNIKEKIKKFDWNTVIKGSFALNYISDNERSSSLSARYGGMVYDRLKTPKVDLEKPKTSIIVVKTKKNVYVCVLEFENRENFNARKSQNRIVNIPISLHPKLARACVNLTGSSTSIYDPFCGAGGFLIEAGLMGLKVVGSDISKRMVNASKKNLDFFKIKNTLFRKNALKIDKKYDYIVTDLPYGRNTRITGNLNKFISNLKKIVKKRAVIMINRKLKIKYKAHYSIYVHKSMTKEIYVI